MLKRILIIFILILISINISLAATCDPGHNATQICAGTFGSQNSENGAYIFPGGLTATNTIIAGALTTTGGISSGAGISGNGPLTISGNSNWQHRLEGSIEISPRLKIVPTFGGAAAVELNSAGTVRASTFCFGTDCRTGWPSPVTGNIAITGIQTPAGTGKIEVNNRISISNNHPWGSFPDPGTGGLYVDGNTITNGGIKVIGGYSQSSNSDFEIDFPNMPGGRFKVDTEGNANLKGKLSANSISATNNILGAYFGDLTTTGGYIQTTPTNLKLIARNGIIEVTGALSANSISTGDINANGIYSKYGMCINSNGCTDPGLNNLYVVGKLSTGSINIGSCEQKDSGPILNPNGEEVTVLCSTGKKVFGGGASCSAGYLVTSKPNSNMNGWTGECYATLAKYISLYAICC